MKKIISTVLAAGMLLSSQSAFASVMPISEKPVEDAVYNTISEPTPEDMENMIKKVRPLIVVPEEYTAFDWDYSGGYGYASSVSWFFSWTDNETGEISVSCDSEGRITSYRLYSYNRGESELPRISSEDLLSVAEEFINSTAPYLSDIDLRAESVNYDFYRNCYEYVFSRYENDIPVPDNYVRVTVNYETKAVESFASSINTDVEFISPEKLISEEEAKSILSETQQMTLSYRLKTEYDENGNVTDRKAYLVYSPTLSYVSVDAVTGEVYTQRNTWEAVEAPTANGAAGDLFFDSALKEESTEMEAGSSPEYSLSEEELAGVAILESLITKDEATKAVLGNEDLYIIENAYLSDARLTKKYSYAVPLNENGEKQEKYVWNLYFLEAGDSYLGMNAVVDAETGELISYYADLPYVYLYEEKNIEEPEIKYTQEQAIEIASEFIKKMQPEKAKSVVYSSSYDYSPYKYVETEDGYTNAVYRANRLTFVRQNEGVDFTYNSFSLGVDRATGKVTRYSYTWYDDVEFESPNDAITPDDALMALYNGNGFGVNYEINSNYMYYEEKLNSVTAEVYTRAVYSLYSPLSTTVRALDGKIVNYSGEEIVPSAFTGEYSDMQNHWAKDTVERFTWIGLGPDSDKFEPNAKISQEEFASLLMEVDIYSYTNDTPEYETFTRMDAVKYIIDTFGYGKIAALENVFITDFADNADFEKEDIGYAAIARGFGLIEGDGENFRPYDNLTRAEAYTIVENVLDLDTL